jgi:excisionase family DNA binding protein
MENRMTVEEAAAVLGCDTSQVRRLHRSGKLPGERIGKRVILLYADAVRAFADAARPKGGWPRGRPRKQPEGNKS